MHEHVSSGVPTHTATSPPPAEAHVARPLPTKPETTRREHHRPRCSPWPAGHGPWLHPAPQTPPDTTRPWPGDSRAEPGRGTLAVQRPQEVTQTGKLPPETTCHHSPPRDVISTQMANPDTGLEGWGTTGPGATQALRSQLEAGPGGPSSLGVCGQPEERSETPSP